ncbi:MAG: tRNA (guanosine(46)-N7)-methyltransferase TrmB [Chthoniobacterales bacterium]
MHEIDASGSTCADLPIASPLQGLVQLPARAGSQESDQKLSAWLATSCLPLEIDVGCHRGAFVVEMASRYPGSRFLGIERQRSRAERCGSKLRRIELANGYVVQGDGLDVASRILPDRSVAKIHVSFPDPWPKRRHHVRRMVNEEFLHAAHRLLAVGGELRLMTDDEPYFRAMELAANQTAALWSEAPWEDGREVAETEFQRKFAAKGLVPFRLALRVRG